MRFALWFYVVQHPGAAVLVAFLIGWGFGLAWTDAKRSSGRWGLPEVRR